MRVAQREAWSVVPIREPSVKGQAGTAPRRSAGYKENGPDSSRSRPRSPKATSIFRLSTQTVGT
jgi:hypothetical protein